MDIIAAYLSAEDTFEDVLRQVPENAWDLPSRCPGWTVRDVVGHLVWGRRAVAACAGGDPLTDDRGAPGAEHPAALLTREPRTAWLVAREYSDALLTARSLSRPAPEFIRRFAPDATLGQVLDNLTADVLCHSWDISSVVGAELQVAPAALRRAMRGVERGLPRVDGFYADAHEPAAGATPFERFLALTGRRR